MVKFKYNDKVFIEPQGVYGEVTNIVPIGMVNGKPYYHYQVHTITNGFVVVPEQRLSKIENETH